MYSPDLGRFSGLVSATSKSDLHSRAHDGKTASWHARSLLHCRYFIHPVTHLLASFEDAPLVVCTDLGDPGGDAPFNSNSNKAVKLSPPLLVGDPGASSPIVGTDTPL